METLQWLLAEIARSLEGLSSARLTYGLSFAGLGLATGGILAWVAGRNGAYQRADNSRTKIAALNDGYIPLLFAVFGGWFGAVYGEHTAADQFVAQRIKPLTQYGQSYLSQATAIVPQIAWDRHQGKTLAEALSDEMAQKLGTEKDSKAHRYFSVINQAAMHQALKETGVSDSKGDPAAVWRAYQSRRLPGNAFIGLPRMIQQQFSTYFGAQYGLVFWVFLPFLLLPVAEYLAFRFSGRAPQVYQAPPRTHKPVTAAVPRPATAALKTAEPTLPEIKETSEDMKVAVEAPVAAPAQDPPAAEPVAEPPVMAEIPPPTIPAEAAPETPVPEAEAAPETPEARVEPQAAAEPVAAAVEPAKPKQSYHSIPTIQTSNNMKLTPSSTAVTYVLGGALLQLYAGIGSGWLSVFVAIFGFVIFYVGLEKLKWGLDGTGQSAVSMLKLAAIIGAIAAVIDLIPLIGGIVASLGYMAAYVIELVGYLKLKDSKDIGMEGRSGATYLLIAMILAVVQSVFGLLPFVGAFIAGPIGLAALMLVFFGWVKIQEGMHQVASTAEN